MTTGPTDAGESETVVLKLGGSVITEKDSPETVDEDALTAAVEALAGTDARLVLVHGGGSFGHHHAAEHGVTTATGTHDPAGALAIHEAMVDLNQAVVDALQSHSVRALPVQPLSVADRGPDGDLSFPSGAVGGLLAEAFVPVVHGDVIAHQGAGVSVLSGDEIVVALAQSLDADRVGLCSTVPGVFDESGTVIDRVTSFDDVAAAVGESEATDVTGGMAGKVDALLDLGIPAQIFGPDALVDFVAGESPGTTVDGSATATDEEASD